MTGYALRRGAAAQGRAKGVGVAQGHGEGAFTFLRYALSPSILGPPWQDATIAGGAEPALAILHYHIEGSKNCAGHQGHATRETRKGTSQRG